MCLIQKMSQIKEYLKLKKCLKFKKYPRFVILEVQFHHERSLSETRYFELFSLTWSRLSPYQKSTSAEAPFNLFWTLIMILAIFAFWKVMKYFWYKIWVTIFTKSATSLDWEIPSVRNNCLLLDFFLRLKTYWTPKGSNQKKTGKKRSGWPLGGEGVTHTW